MIKELFNDVVKNDESFNKWFSSLSGVSQRNENNIVGISYMLKDSNNVETCESIAVWIPSGVKNDDYSKQMVFNSLMWISGLRNFYDIL